MAVRIEAHLVDGGVLEFEGAQYLLSFETLAAQGLKGKQLIHALLTDDWGAPPQFIRIYDGEQLVATVPYT